MHLPDCPGTFEGTHEPGTERPDDDAARRLDLDPGPVLRFAQELGRLLGDHLARAGFPSDAPTAQNAVPPHPRRRRDP